MDGIQMIRQNLPRQVKVPQVSPGVVPAGITPAVFIRRPGVIAEAAIFYNNSAPGCKEHSIPGIAGRHDTVKHVNSAENAFNQVLGSSHAHEVDGALLV